MKSLSGRRFCRVLEAHGWQLQRVHGSHHIYTRKSDDPQRACPWQQRSQEGHARWVAQSLWLNGGRSVRSGYRAVVLRQTGDALAKRQANNTCSLPACSRSRDWLAGQCRAGQAAQTSSCRLDQIRSPGAAEPVGWRQLDDGDSPVWRWLTVNGMSAAPGKGH